MPTRSGPSKCTIIGGRFADIPLDYEGPCPCCDSWGHHVDLAGNDPDSLLYPCETCGGTGQID